MNTKVEQVRKVILNRRVLVLILFVIALVALMSFCLPRVINPIVPSPSATPTTTPMEITSTWTRQPSPTLTVTTTTMPTSTSTMTSMHTLQAASPTPFYTASPVASPTAAETRVKIPTGHSQLPTAGTNQQNNLSALIITSLSLLLLGYTLYSIGSRITTTKEKHG